MKNIYLSADGRVRNGWKILGFILAVVASGITISRIAKLLHAPKASDTTVVWVNAAIVLLLSWIFTRIERERFSSLGYRLNGRWAAQFLAGTLGGIALILLAAVISMGFGAVSLVRSGTGAVEMLNGAMFFLGVGIFEESAFRGYLFQRASRGIGFTGAQIVMALFFALAHWGNPGMSGATRIWASLDISLAAVLLGLCWKRTGSLALPIGVHLGWNWAQGNLLGFGVSGTSAAGFFKPVFAAAKPEWMSGGAFGLEAGLPGVIACALAILIVWKWKGRSSEDADFGGAFQEA